MIERKYLLLFATCLCFIVIEVLLIDWVDLPLSNLMRSLDSTHHGIIDGFRAITDFGKSGWYLWPSGIGTILCLIGLRWRTVPPAAKRVFGEIGPQLLFLFLSVALSGIATDIVKPLIGRARPVEWERAQIYGFRPWSFHAVFNSLPSGHATTAATVSLAASLVWPRLRWPCLTIGLILAVSRVIVNAHYLSDIIAGIAVGITTVVILYWLRNHNGIKPIIERLFPLTK